MRLVAVIDNVNQATNFRGIALRLYLQDQSGVYGTGALLRRLGRHIHGNCETHRVVEIVGDISHAYEHGSAMCGSISNLD
jgi:hypothetical protein